MGAWQLSDGMALCQASRLFLDVDKGNFCDVRSLGLQSGKLCAVFIIVPSVNFVLLIVNYGQPKWFRSLEAILKSNSKT